MFNSVGNNSRFLIANTFDQAVTPIMTPAQNAFENLDSYFSDFDSYDVHPFVVIIISLASVLTIYTIARAIFKIKPVQPLTKREYILPETPWPYETIKPYRYEKMITKAKCTKNREAIYNLILDAVKTELIDRKGYHNVGGMMVFRTTYAYVIQLESLFGTPEAVADYILDFKEKYPFSKHPIHDACLFVMPPDDAVWNVSIWRDLIIKNGYSTDWMNMLPFAPALESYFYRHLTNFKTLEESGHTEQKISQLYRNQLKRLNQNLKDVFPIEYSAFQAVQDKIANMKKMKKPKNPKIIAEASSNAVLTPPRPTNDKFAEAAFAQFIIKSRTPSQFNLQSIYSVMRTVYYPQGVPKDEEPILLEFIKYGVSPKQYVEVQNIVQNTPKAYDEIPNISIMGEKINCPGHWLEKMDPKNPLLAIAGGLTGCCQSINGNGRDVVLHALTSPYGGIYRIMKGQDIWVAQAWAGKTEANELVFDSIEWNMIHDSKMVMKFFEHLAKEIIRTDPSITRVLFGGGGNTPVNHKYPLQAKPYSPIRDYKDPDGLPGYDSSEERFELARR